MADETTQGVHPFTVDWWNRLPNIYRRADRVQGYRLRDSWAQEGGALNLDPRFITGWDGWYRLNTSNEAWAASMSFTRTFRATPNVPVHIRTWHEPVLYAQDGTTVAHLEGTGIRHVVRNHSGIVIADENATGGTTSGETVIVDAGDVIMGDEHIYDGGTPSTAPADGNTTEPAPEAPAGKIIHHTVVTPDRFGTIQVSIHITLTITDPDLSDETRLGPGNFLEAIHVGTKDVTFSQLPAADYFATAAAYPLLRFMDGIGHQAGYVSDMANAMHAGAYSDPLTAPESSLPFLAAVLGVPTRYSDKLTAAELRVHLVDMVEGNSPTPGSRQHITITAKQWLTGTKDVSVTPAHTTQTPDPEGARTALIAAAGYNDGNPTTIHVQDRPYLEGHQTIRWTGAIGASISEWRLNEQLLYENLMLNPAFTFNTNYWGIQGNSSLTHDPAGAALLETTGDSVLHIPAENHIPTNGGHYTLRFWVYPSAADVRASAVLQGATDNPNITINHSSTETLLTAGAWQLVEVSGLMDGAVAIEPMLVLKATTGTIWVDDTQLSRTTYTAPSYFDGDYSDPQPPFWHDIWVTTRGNAHLWEGGQWVHKPDLYPEADTVALGGFTRDTVHTLIVSARADEIPPGMTLADFAQFLNDAGVIPAGHRVITREGTPTWDQWTAATGSTWDEKANVIRTWNDSDSAGLVLGNEGA